VYNNLGEPHKAIDFFEQSLVITHQISDHRGEGITLWNLSQSKLVERTQAIAYAEAALKIFEKIEDSHTEMVRRQLEVWHKQTDKRWWQFWRK